MPIDVHAHYSPMSIIEVLEDKAKDYGLSLVKHPPSCQCALHFDYGLKVRPFFAKLVEPVEERLAGMDAQGVDHQVLSMWSDIFAYGLPRETGARWHRLLNEHLAAVCAKHDSRFSLLASVPLPNADDAAHEAEYAMKKLGAVGLCVAANVEGVNLGEVEMDAFWQAAVELDAPVFIHPVQAMPAPRTAKFALTQVAQYTFDTTLCLGSLIFSGVLDRFPKLKLILSHGGGAFPYLLGRFDCMSGRMDRAAQGAVSQNLPSAYRENLYFDSLLHDPVAIRYLVEKASAQHVVLGSDYSFPPADHDPVGTVRRAELGEAVTELILDGNALRLFPRLNSTIGIRGAA